MRDPLIRRFLLGTGLSALFVAVVIRYFGLSTDRALDFLLGSFVLVAGIILLAGGAAFLLSLFRRRSDFDDVLEGPSHQRSEDASIDESEDDPGEKSRIPGGHNSADNRSEHQN